MKHKKSCPKRCIFGCLGCLGTRNLFRCLSCCFPETELYIKKQKKKTIYLTIDDYPSRDPDNSYKLLDILDKHNVKASFFIIKYNVLCNNANKAVMHSTVSRGHELGNHMAKDTVYTSHSKEDFSRILLDVENVIEQYQPGFKKNFPKLFRAPSGKINKNMCNVLTKNNYLSILGDVYSFDAEYDADPEFHCNLLLNNVKSGSILILHTPENYMRKKTLELLELLIPKLKKKGFSFEILSKYFKRKEYLEYWQKKHKKDVKAESLI